MTYHHATPAYGREYANDARVISAWLNGSDFYLAPNVMSRGGYCSVRELESGDTANVYYIAEDGRERIVPLTRDMVLPRFPDDDTCEHLFLLWGEAVPRCEECGKLIHLSLELQEGETVDRYSPGDTGIRAHRCCVERPIDGSYPYPEG